MRLVVGRVVRPHGVRGEVVVQPTSDQPEARFSPGSRLETDDGRLLEVVASRPHSGRLLVRLRGLRSREDAEAVRRTRLWADVTATPQEEGVFYDADLVGLAVRDRAGHVLGRVAAVEHGPAQDLLVVERADGPPVRVPFVAALVPRVEPGEGWLEVDLPDGLLELDR